MDWKKSLDDYRAKLIRRLNSLSELKSSAMITMDGERVPLLQTWKESLKKNIAEIEEILKENGVQLD